MRALDLIARIGQRIKRLRRPPTVDVEAVEEVERIEWSYDLDGLKTLHNCDFLKDPLFAEAYKLGKATGSWSG